MDPALDDLSPPAAGILVEPATLCLGGHRGWAAVAGAGHDSVEMRRNGLPLSHSGVFETVSASHPILWLAGTFPIVVRADGGGGREDARTSWWR